MRLVLAADLDADERKAAVRTARSSAQGFEQAGIPLCCMQPEHLHFSFRLLGELDVKSAGEVRRALVGAWETAVFHAGLDGFDVFRYSGTFQVFWLGMGTGRDEVFVVETELDRRLRRLGSVPEVRAYRLHLTLGCVRRQSEPSRAVVKPLLAESPTDPVRWTVEMVTLYESRLSYGGASYKFIEQFSLPQQKVSGGQS